MNDPDKPGWPDRHVWEIVPIREAMLVAGAVVLVWLGLRVSEVLLPLFVGVLIAYIASPLVGWAERRLSLPRPVSAGILLALLVGAVVGVGIWLGPIMGDQVRTLIERLPDYLDWLGLTDGSLNWRELAERARERVMDSQWEASEVLAAIGGVLGLTTRALYWLLIPPITFFFFVWWMPSIPDTLLRYVPASRRDETREVLDEMNEVVGGFLRGRLTVSLIISVLFSLAFLLAGVPYWFALGVATGMLSIVPYVSLLGWAGAMVLVYVDRRSGGGDFSWLAVLLWPSLAYSAVNLLEEWLLIPWFQSKSMNLSSFTILIVVLIGGELAGVLGLFLSVPITGCLKILVIRLVKPPLERWASAR